MPPVKRLAPPIGKFSTKTPIFCTRYIGLLKPYKAARRNSEIPHRSRDISEKP